MGRGTGNSEWHSEPLNKATGAGGQSVMQVLFAERGEPDNRGTPTKGSLRRPRSDKKVRRGNEKWGKEDTQVCLGT